MTWLALGLVVALVLAWTTRAHTQAARSPAIVAASEPVSRQHISAASSRPHPRASRPSRRPTVGNPGAVTVTRRPAATGAAVTVTTATTPEAPPPAPPPTTTVAPVPAVRVSSLSGSLSFPNDVATTYFPSAEGGALVVSGSWSASRTLELTLSCGAQAVQSAGAGGARLALPAADGSCRLLVAEPPGATWRANYALEVRAAAPGAR